MAGLGVADSRPIRHRVQDPPGAMRPGCAEFHGDGAARGREEGMQLLVGCRGGRGQLGQQSWAPAGFGAVLCRHSCLGENGQQCGPRRQLTCVQACVCGFNSRLSPLRTRGPPSQQGKEQGVSCSASCCPGSPPCPGDSQSGMEGPEAAQPGTYTVCRRPEKDTHQLDTSAGKESALPRRVASSISQTGRAGQGSPSSFRTNTDSAPHLPSAFHPPG